MSVSMGFFTFLNTWFLMMFFVLPFYIRPAQRMQDTDYVAAPSALPWKRFLLTNTLVSVVVTLLLALIIHSGWFDVRDSLT